MSYEQGILIAVLSSILTLLGKIVFDWLRPKNGNGKKLHEIERDVEMFQLLKRVFDNIVENQNLLRKILDEIRGGGK